MELSKIKKDVNISFLINEISDIVKLKLKEDTMISRYKRMVAINMAMESLKAKNKEAERIATTEYNLEALSIYHDIAIYQLEAEYFSEYWKPEKLIKVKENEEFKNDEDFKEAVQHIKIKMELDISNAEFEIRNARTVLKKYSHQKESEGKDNE